MIIGVASDGQYGERAYELIKKRFPATWILLPFPSAIILDEIEFTIPSSDLYISYLRHPDVAMYLVQKGVPVILGVNHGQGFLHQANEYNSAVFGPETICSLIPDTGSGPVNEFAKIYGRPSFHLVLEGERIVCCYPLRRSPCGSTDAAARELEGKILNIDTLNRFALSVCHNCRAPRFGKTCDKEKAGLIHIKELLRAVKGVNQDLWEDIVQKIEKR